MRSRLSRSEFGELILKLEDLNYEYPESLVATERAQRSRFALVRDKGEVEEISRQSVVELFSEGDVWVVNQTKVLKRRVFTQSGLEILFLSPQNSERTIWSVLCPASRWKQGATERIEKPGSKDPIELELVSRGRPQTVQSNEPLTEEFFVQVGELPIPPYIQRARSERHNRPADEFEYQSVWAEEEGSLAAPTASFHFDREFEEKLRSRGVIISYVTLHVGIGTFLPVTVSDLKDHVMHSEWASIPQDTALAIQRARANGKRVIAVGTTVARTLESWGVQLKAPVSPEAAAKVAASGETDLMICPGHQWRYVDVLVTNFHQPKSTLLALVAGFSSLEKVKEVYAWAIERKFRLFSYGDCSIWIGTHSPCRTANATERETDV